jgi:hypothetical protein
MGANKREGQRCPAWTKDQHQALHGLNARLHAITVMTYDYLLAQAEALLAIFAAPPEE